MNTIPLMHKTNYSLGQRAPGPLALLNLWQRRREERRQLSQLPEELLQDIGLTPEQVRVEAAKPFWRA